jgi:proteasome-associated ATPase
MKLLETTTATIEFEIVENAGRDTDPRLLNAVRQNDILRRALHEARNEIMALRTEVDKLSAPPSTYGVYLSAHDDDTVDVLAQGRKVRVGLNPTIKVESLRPGQELLLNEALNVVAAAGYEIQGDVVVLKARLGDDRAVVTVRADDEKIGIIADPLRTVQLKPGDHILMDSKSGYLLERLPKSEAEELGLEEVPDIGYRDVGGLSLQIEAIQDAVELPYLYPAHYKEHKLRPSKGVLLYGPPGCGKTMIAKAVANSLAEKVSKERGEKVTAYFLNVKGPELLNKYVGETERKIREVFQKAKEKAADDVPVVIFFDEMDALFRTRGTGISSDVESTIVPQFLTEVDGVEGLRNVVVIGASNRPDLIDPAILRAGRLDLKIKVDRPDRAAAGDIFQKYLTHDLPIAAADTRRHGGVDAAVDAMIASVVRRAKKLALKRCIGGGEKGLVTDDLVAAVREEFKENEDLPNTSNPDDWAKIAGRKGERIVAVKSLVGLTRQPQRNMEKVVTTGQYL